MITNEDEYDLHFDFEDVLEEKDAENYNKEASKEICKFYLRGHCAKGKDCPFRHVRAEKAVVCKHWLRGLCKKGDACEFLHEYNPKKMPECWFFAKYQECSNAECIFLHIKPEDKIKPCPWYARGFCKHGPNCRLKHIQRVACPDYMAGFCTKGPNCKFAHPKWEIPKDIGDHLAQNSEFGVRRKAMRKPTNIQQQQRSIPTLHGDTDSSQMLLSRPAMMNPTMSMTGAPMGMQQHRPRDQQRQTRPLHEVQCYKCKQYGHYANACPNPRVADAMEE